MPRQRDLDIKVFIEQVGTLFDARAKTWEINFKTHVDNSIKASEDRMLKALASKEELKALESKVATIEELKELESKIATKQDLKTLRAEMATKQHMFKLENKIDKTQDLQRLVDELRKRLDRVEAELAALRSRN